MKNLAEIRFLFVICALAVCFAMFLPINQPGGTASNIDMELFDPEKVDELDHYFEAEQKRKEAQLRKLKRLLKEVKNVGTVNSIVIFKDDQKLGEAYFDEMHADKAVNIKSASKSILSLLMGIAIREGFLEGVNQTLDEFFPEYFKKSGDTAKASITLQDLLTMRSGLRTTSFDHYKDWVASENWVWYTLNRPLIEKAGTKMVYSTGTSHLLSVILTKASGMNTKDFVNKYLFEPMDIEFKNWIKDPQGYYLGGNDMALKPEDMIKIGKLVMNNGNYNGLQLVPESWIKESLQTYTKSTASDYNYGYMWWNENVSGYTVNFAWGYAGQYILMFPDFNAVVAVTSNIEKNKGSRKYQKEMFEFIEHHLIPYFESEEQLNYQEEMITANGLQ